MGYTGPLPQGTPLDQWSSTHSHLETLQGAALARSRERERELV